LDKQLQRLDEKMNSTVMKDISFDANHKDGVFKRIDRKEQKETGLSFKRTFTSILSFAVPVTFLIGMFSFIGLDFDGDTKNALSSNTPQSDSKGFRAEKINQTEQTSNVYTPKPNEELYDDFTKEEIVSILLNANKKFETAKGSYEEYNVANGKIIVDYQLITTGEQKGGYSKVFIISQNGEKTINESQYFDKNYVWQINYQHKNYVKDPNSGGNRPMIGIAQNSLFPYEIVNNYLGEFNNWEIEKQNEELLGHNTIVTKGILSEYAKGKHKSNTFRFWVDKDTGILLKYETYNEKGEVVNYIHPNEFIINGPIDREALDPNIEGLENFRK
jgi:outer membrane lipoprotein-sorting protein